MNRHDRWTAMAHHWWHGFNILVNRHKVRNSEPILIALCAPLGAMVGLVVVTLHQLVSWLHVHDFGLAEGAYLSAGQGIDPYRLAGVPVLGGLIVGLLAVLTRRMRSRQIIDPIEANALYGGRMSFTGSLRLALSTLISNAAGASVGMRQPIRNSAPVFCRSPDNFSICVAPICVSLLPPGPPQPLPRHSTHPWPVPSTPMN